MAMQQTPSKYIQQQLIMTFTIYKLTFGALAHENHDDQSFLIDQSVPNQTARNSWNIETILFEGLHTFVSFKDPTNGTVICVNSKNLGILTWETAPRTKDLMPVLLEL